MSRVRLLGCLVLVVGVFLSGIPIHAASSPAAGAGEYGTSAGVLDVPPAGNNSSVQQRNPERLAESGDSRELSRWFQRALATRLSQNAIELSQGQYEQADGLLGEEYEDMLGKYVNVAGETEDTDTATEAAYQDATETQQAFGDVVREYNRVYADYQAAVEAGNEDRARRLARRLQALATRTDRLHADLLTSYHRISNNTDQDLSQAAGALNETAGSIDTRTTTILAQEFVQTSLSVTAAPNGSFTAPVRITGTLQSENGSVPASPVRIRVNGRAFDVALAENGSFAVAYRPVRAAVGQHAVSVVYDPANASTYLGATATARTRIQSVPPVISATTPQGAVGFGDVVRVTGTVSVDGTVVPGAPVAVRLNGRTIARTRTNQRGGFRVTPRLSALPPVGDQSIRIVAGRNGTAISGGVVQQSITVSQTETELSLSVQHPPQGPRLQGQLTTTDGVGLGNREVVIYIGGRRVQTIETNSTGHYTATYSDPVAGDGVVPVRVAFTGEGLNLGNASAHGELQPTAPQKVSEPNLLNIGRLSPWWLLVVGAGAVLGLGYAGRRFMATRGSDSAAGGDRGGDGGGGDGLVDSGGAAESWIVDRVRAAESLAADGNHGEAIRMVYPAARAVLQADLDNARGLTNWEFYQAVASNVDRERAGVLRVATEAYERVQYAESPPDGEVVTEVVAGVAELVGDGDRAVYPSGSQRDD